MTIEDMFQISVKGIIVNKQNQILLLQANDNGDLYWDLPGGRVCINEKFKHTLYREVSEETGIASLVDTKYLGLISSIKRISHKNGLSVGLVYAMYITKFMGDPANIKLSAEHFHFEWIDVIDSKNILDKGYGPELHPLLMQNFKN